MRVGINHDAVFLHERLAVVPGEWREKVRRIHAAKLKKAEPIPAGTGRKNEAIAAANLWLVGTTERMAALKIPVSTSDGELCEIAVNLARECMGLAQYGAGQYLTDIAAIRARMSVFVCRYGIEAPGNKIEDRPAVSRMTCHLWWRRRLRVAQGRAIEAEAIRLGYVHKRAEIYASDVTVKQRQQQKRRNAAAMEAATASNLDTGQEFQLAELAARSVANPTIRRGELMCRIAGFESVARGLGHVGIFITQTCPARMHRMRTAGGRVMDNPKYDGTTPKEAARWLSKKFQLIRAALARAGAAIYGFRIAEPHHDGTPHWHALIFCAISAAKTVLRIWARYARAEDAEEMNSKEARKARFHAVFIDWKRGTAAGYIAKYVSKNIDGGGYQVQGDVEGYDAIMPAHRVEAWAARWRIHQFQQVGGPPVGAWRELRRSAPAEGASDAYEEARSAADVGNWERFVQVMGGPTVRRVDLPLRVAVTRPGERWNFVSSEPEPAPLNSYGEPAAPVVFGVLDVKKGRAFQSRRFRWEVRRKLNVREKSMSFSSPGFMDASKSGDLEGKACKSEFESIGRPAQPVGPWSPVNNCTEGEEGEKNAGNEGFRENEEFAVRGAGCVREVGQGAALCAGHGRGIHAASDGGIGGNRGGFADGGKRSVRR